MSLNAGYDSTSLKRSIADFSDSEFPRPLRLAAIHKAHKESGKSRFRPDNTTQSRLEHPAVLTLPIAFVYRHTPAVGVDRPPLAVGDALLILIALSTLLIVSMLTVMPHSS